jgi:perosamine synthetase
MSKPSVGKDELKMIEGVFASGWLGEGGTTEQFEREIAAFTGAPHVVAVNTGTSALHLALHVLGIGRGDEVILPSMTFVSDPMAVMLSGARPVFCDIEWETLNIDPDRVAELITPKTKAILPTDFSGLPSNVRAIRKVIREKDIKIIRDASHSFGSMIDDKVIGVSAGEDITCLSFDPIKNLTCGEGGALLLKDSSLGEKLRSQKMLGIVKSTWYSFSKKKMEDRRVEQMGFRYHLSNVNAAIGLAQLKKFNKFVLKRQLLAKRYDELLAKNKHITLFKRDYNQIVPFMYIIRVQANERDPLMKYLIEKGIHAGLRYYPCHLQPFFGHRRSRELPVTEQVAEEMLSIPLFTDLTLKQLREIVAAINSYFD